MLRRVALCTLLATTPVLAQGGGFTSHDLLIHSPSLAGVGSALVQVDLATGVASILVDATQIAVLPGAAAFDPWRQRVLFMANMAEVGKPQHLWAVDAAGQLDDLGFAAKPFKALAPTGDGRVYLHDGSSTAPFKYLDATNTLRTLMDATGTAPFLLDGGAFVDVPRMIHDTATGALFVASGLHVCGGGAANKVNVRKLPLSADGSRVAGPVTCAQFEVSASGEGPMGWSRGPAGQLMLVIDTNASGIAPKILLVDPATLGFSVFASPGGYTGDPAVAGGSWAPSLGQGLLLDQGGGTLRAYSAGESGVGAVLPLTGASLVGSSYSVFAVEASDCAGGWMAYGAGLGGSGGLVPTLTGGDCPQTGGLFSLDVAQGVGGAAGQLFVGLAPAASPLKGGTFLVGGLVLVLPVGLGGSAGVPGAGSLSLPAALPADPLLVGAKIYLQVGLQDAGAVKGAALTNGLRMEIG